MKKLILLLTAFFFICLSGMAQDSLFIIDGKLEKIKTGVIYLSIYQKDKTLLDSSRIRDGVFKFTGVVRGPYFASLTMPAKKEDFFSFYIAPGKMLITGRANELKRLAIKDDGLNADDKRLQSRLHNIILWEENTSNLFEKAYAENNKALMDSLEQVDMEILITKRSTVAAFIKENPASLRSALAILENFSYYAEAEDVEPLYAILDKKIQESPKGREILKMIESYKRTAIGNQAPDINQPSPDGTTVSLHSQRGKYVLIDFWASWCAPCRRENENLVATFNAFSEKGFTIFGVSYDTKKENWLKAIETDNLHWTQVSSLDGWSNPTSEMYAIKAIPSNVLIDPNGIIIAKNIFGKKLTDFLKEVFHD